MVCSSRGLFDISATSSAQDARSGDSTLFYKLIKQQRRKLSRFIEELNGQISEEFFIIEQGVRQRGALVQ
jgi:hypothetical protein